MTYLVTFIRPPECRYVIAVSAPDAIEAMRTGAVRLLASLDGDHETLTEWAWRSTELG